MKNLIFSLIVIFLFTSCENETLDYEQDDLTAIALKGKQNNVTVCHYDSDLDTWESININDNALNSHLNHGDVSLVDADGDGYVVDANEQIARATRNKEEEIRELEDEIADQKIEIQQMQDIKSKIPQDNNQIKKLLG